MTATRLDLTGLKCPLPALKTRKALKALKPGDRLEVHCTDPLSVIDIPNLIRETGDKVEISERTERQIVFLIEKAGGVSPVVAGARDWKWKHQTAPPATATRRETPDTAPFF